MSITCLFANVKLAREPIVMLNLCDPSSIEDIPLAIPSINLLLYLATLITSRLDEKLLFESQGKFVITL